VISRQGIRPAATGSGAGRVRRANRTFHDHVDVTGLGESPRSKTDGVDMTMQTQMRPGLDRSEVWLGALGGAFGRISDGSSGVDRSEVAGNALVGALVQISHRSPALIPEIQLIALQKRSALTDGRAVRRCWGGRAVPVDHHPGRAHRAPVDLQAGFQ
jgi:hypothetical protein